MSNLLPPMPNGVPPGSFWWNDWYEKLRTIINGLSALQHNLLAGLQGGTAGEYFHLTSAQYTNNITNFNETAQDAIAAAFAAGTQTGISITYNDVANSFDFTVSGGGVSLAQVKTIASYRA